MNKISLSALYQRMTVNQSAAGDVSSEDLAAVAEGSLAADRRDAAASAIAASSAQAKLVRMLRDLAPESATLASAIGNTERVTGHRRHQRGERRIAVERRRTGVA